MRQLVRRTLMAALLCSAIARAVGAQIPMGPETRVSTGLTGNTGDKTRPSVTPPAPDGSFVVVWTKDTPPYDVDIVARRYSAAGVPIGPEFLVNSYTTGRQADPSISSDAAGNFVVVWTRYDVQMPYGRHVFGQSFDRSGARLGAEFPASQPPGWQWRPSVSSGPGGFVVAWNDIGAYSIVARRFDSAGAPIGGEFEVSSPAPLLFHLVPSVASTANGDFVIVWDRAGVSIEARLYAADGSPLGAQFQAGPGPLAIESSVGRASSGSFVVAWRKGALQDSTIVAQRFDANGTRLGGEYNIVNPNTSAARNPQISVDPDGDFVLVWDSRQDGSETGVVGRRFASTGVGPEFRVNTYTTGRQEYPSVATDPAGNFVVIWQTPGVGVDFQRYAGGLMGMETSVDASAGLASDGNGVLEAGETVAVAPSWLNADFVPQTFSGTLSSFTGPGAPGDPIYSITDAAALYGAVASGATRNCTATADCYALEITIPTTRPATHWDATVREQLVPPSLGAEKLWTFHVGDSFSDVPRPNGFYRFVETLLHHGVTGGCTASAYCPASSTTREQMAVFVLVAKDGAGYVPPPCLTPPFADVPVGSPYCRWIAELARRNVVSGCGGGNYCPTAPVSRQEMAVFALLTKEPGLTPPACGVPMFNDVPASSPFCPWIEELARRGVVTGCGAGAYCPTAPVTREQMGVFLSVTFGLALYGP